MLSPERFGEPVSWVLWVLQLLQASPRDAPQCGCVHPGGLWSFSCLLSRCVWRIPRADSRSRRNKRSVSAKVRHTFSLHKAGGRSHGVRVSELCSHVLSGLSLCWGYCPARSAARLAIGTLPAVQGRRTGLGYALFQLKLSALPASALHLLLMYGFAPIALRAHVKLLVCSDPFLHLTLILPLESSDCKQCLSFQGCPTFFPLDQWSPHLTKLYLFFEWKQLIKKPGPHHTIPYTVGTNWMHLKADPTFLVFLHEVHFFWLWSQSVPQNLNSCSHYPWTEVLLFQVRAWPHVLGPCLVYLSSADVLSCHSLSNVTCHPGQLRATGVRQLELWGEQSRNAAPSRWAEPKCQARRDPVSVQISEEAAASCPHIGEFSPKLCSSDASQAFSAVLVR